jgi:AAA family ATPase
VAHKKLTKRKDSGVELPVSSRESTKKIARIGGLDIPGARLLVLRGAAFPFRLKGDPRAMGVETDNAELFADYAREQWIGSVIKKGQYLFDRYVMPDFAFQVTEVDPAESIVTNDTVIRLDSSVSSSDTPNRETGLDDVVGHETVKKKCRVILNYLEAPARYGEWAPRTLLFHGSPGTGKTMLAKAMASEANARIFLVKASDLIGVHVGDGGRRISALFEDARNTSPSIVFIDELDAIGLSRSFQSIRGDVSEVVTALLGELDKTDEGSGVVVIGATNAIMLIDPALRSRFDTVFEFKLPDSIERLKILEMYAARLPLPIDIDLQLVALRTEGLSGRDLRNRVLKEALHSAISEDHSSITRDTILSVLDKIKVKHVPDYAI